MFLIGVCLAELGQHEEAVDRFSQVSRQYPETPEAVAADFKAAELLGHLGRDNDSVERYRQVLTRIGDHRAFSNPWVTLDDLRQTMQEACQRYSQNGQFDTALALAGSLDPIFPRSRVMELKAETHRAWGHHLLQATGLSPADAENLKRTAREQLRRAGASYAALAKLRITTRAYPDDLWASALCFFEGQNYQAAERLIRQYLETETHRRHPQALIHLGQSLLALGRSDEAIQQFEKCIEFFPQDPASFRARLIASAAYREKDEPKKAEALLRENIEGDFLTPASAEWRDSLFALGHLLHGQRRYEEAAYRLDEAVRRYADDNQTPQALYLLGDCYHQTALQAKEQLETEVVPSVREAGSQKVVQLLELAVGYFTKAREKLDRRQQAQILSGPEQSTLRNCYFIIGDLEFDLDRHSKAIQSYALATSRYQNAPETLMAYVQMARAYQHLDQVKEARSVLMQAKLALSRMEPAQDFTSTTNYSRDEWSELLDRMRESMGHTARS
jgi:TolA-binding protein